MFRKLFLVGVLLLIASGQGCDELLNSVEKEQNESPVVYISSEVEVAILDTVTLDGSASYDPEGDDITYTWTIFAKPQGSTASMLVNNDVYGKFVPDVRGNYEVQLAISDGNKTTSDKISLSADVPRITVIDVPTTLEDIFDDPSLVDYVVQTTAYISAALTIAPGVVIEFASGASMDIENSGSIIASGAEGDSIYFTGAGKSAGYWNGLYINSNNPNNILTHCVVEYGGGYYGNIYVNSGSQLRLLNSVTRYSASSGLYGDNEARLPDFSGNIISHNQVAMDLPANLLGSIDSTTDYGKANLYNYIDVRGTGIDTDQVWQAVNVPYHLKSTTTVEADVTINPGAVIQFASGADIDVASGGSLSAVGTATDSILFTGEQQTEGFWGTLHFNSNNPKNKLVYCTVEYGGDYYANIYVTAYSQLTVKNTLSHYSSGDGLFAEADARLPDFANNHFAFNKDAALEVAAHHLGSLDAETVYLGSNTNDYIDVHASTVTTDQSWPATDAPYRFRGYDTYLQAEISVQPGAVLKFSADATLNVEESGALIAVGTMTDSIVFTGEVPAPGFWNNLYINSNNTLNQMSYCDIGYGGGYYANIYVTEGARFLVNNSTIHDSENFGVLVENGGTIEPANPETDGNNVFFNNTAGNVSLE